jgi:glycosyltransferase involved in cell wall biosynthesis
VSTHLQKVAVVIPCFNEASGIGRVVKAFRRDELLHNGFELDIIVVDNNSADNTAAVARRAGARVVEELTPGKGNALRAGFRSISNDTNFVAMLDGDDTYSPNELLRLLEPLKSDFCEVVIGSRLQGKIAHNSMTRFNRVGNWIFTHLVRYVYRANVSDVLTGYFAWKKEVIDELAPHLWSPGFAIEMEMITKMAKMKCEISSVPISYHPRSGSSNLHPIEDGFRIFIMFLRSFVWSPKDAMAHGDLKDGAEA